MLFATKRNAPPRISSPRVIIVDSDHGGSLGESTRLLHRTHTGAPARRRRTAIHRSEPRAVLSCSHQSDVAFLSQLLNPSCSREERRSRRVPVWRTREVGAALFRG